MIAALYVADGGVYFGLPDVDPWPEKRDARLYAGPWPDDGRCFEHALASVRTWGGVLEHPEASHAWAAFGLNRPPRSGGWVVADFHGGWTCCVEQGHYGHPARKATWLYARGVRLPSLRWGSSGTRARLDVGYHSAEERRRARETGRGVIKTPRLTATECSATPTEFRDVLLAMARTVSQGTHAEVRA